MRRGCVKRQVLTALMLLEIALCSCSCLYTRLLSFKEQLASFEKYVAVTNGGCVLEFLEPVVGAGDLTALTGFAPTSIDWTDKDRQIHTYRYRNISSTACSQQNLSFTLRFTSNELRTFEYPAVIADVLGTNLVVAAAKAIGKSRLIQREHQLEWNRGTNQTSTLIPSMAAITRVFGQTHDTNGGPSSLHANYRFLLEGTNGALLTDAPFNADFDFDTNTSILCHGIMHVGKLKLVVDIPVSP